MTNWLREKKNALRGIVDLRDVLAFFGLALVYIGAEQIRSGAGFLTVGLLLFYKTVLQRPSPQIPDRDRGK